MPSLPIAGLDWNVRLVDSTGTAFGTLANPLNAQITGAGSGGTSAVDASAWTTAVSALTPGGGVFNDSAAALTSGQQGTLRMTPNRAQHANLRSQNGTELFPVPALMANGTANPTVTQVAAFPSVFNGTTWDPWKDYAAASNLGAFTGVPAVGIVVLDTVDAQLKRLNSVASAIAGGVSGKNAMAIGSLNYTAAHGAAPTNFAAGVFAAPLMTKAGVPFVATGHPANISQSINYTGAQTNTVVIANTAGTKLVISSILVQASAANTANIAVGVGLAQTVTPPSGTAGRLGGSVALAAGSGFGRKTYQAGADGDQLIVTSTGAGDFSITCEYHLTTTA